MPTNSGARLLVPSRSARTRMLRSSIAQVLTPSAQAPLLWRQVQITYRTLLPCLTLVHQPGFHLGSVGRRRIRSRYPWWRQQTILQDWRQIRLSRIPINQASVDHTPSPSRIRTTAPPAHTKRRWPTRSSHRPTQRSMLARASIQQ
jgi:hypothetical protein